MNGDAALQAWEERYRVAMQAARDGVWDWDIRTGRVDVNPRYLTMLGYLPEPSWLTFDQWHSMVHPEDVERITAAAEHTRLSGEPFEDEYRLREASGGYHWLIGRGRVVECDAAGVALRMAGIHIDIHARKCAEQDAHQAREWLEAALSGGDMAVYEVNLVTGIAQVDDRYLGLLGYQPGEFTMDMETWLALMHPDDQARIQAVIEEIVSGQTDGNSEVEYRMRHKSGEWRWTLDRFRVYTRDARGQALTAGGVHLDITKRKEMEERLRFSAQVFEHTSEGILITDQHGCIQDVNRAFTTITGYTAEEALGRNPSLLRSDRHDQEFYAELWRSLIEQGLWRGEIWNRRKNGEVYPEWLTISAVVDQQGKTTNYISVFSDISPLRQSQDRLDYLAHHDPLTGLPNRLLLTDRLELALVRAQREQRQMALLFIDLDGFKRVNDTLGHAVGDQLLVVVSGRLRERLRRGDTLGRLGGDEFLLLLEQGIEEGVAERVARMVLELLAEPIQIDGHDIIVSASIGISLFPNDGCTGDELLAHADLAMYQTKAAGRAGFTFYHPRMSQSMEAQFNIERSLHGALRRGELQLLYQPQLDLANRRLVGIEALLRWRHPDMGLLEPERFLPVAERLGLMDAIGAWVVGHALEQLVHWRAAGLSIPRLSLHCSPTELRRVELLPLFDAVLERTGVRAEDVELQLQCATLLDENARVCKNLTALRQRGLRLSIGHFGTGGADLGELARLEVDRLKIDHVLVAQIEHDDRILAVCRAIRRLGDDLGLEVVAAGIESSAQLDALRDCGYRYGQGWLLSEPLDASGLMDRLHASAV